jgi:hypothetical protein
MQSTIPASAGYIFNLSGRAFSPDGAIGSPSQADIDAHNARLAAAELEALKASGRGVLYLTRNADGSHSVSQWSGGLCRPVYALRKSWHNMAGKNGRTDFDFSFDGSRWHGVNIGDNQIARVRRCKA